MALKKSRIKREGYPAQNSQSTIKMEISQCRTDTAEVPNRFLKTVIL